MSSTHLRPSARTSVRVLAATAALASGLALAGCGTDDDASATSEAAATTTLTESGSASTGGGTSTSPGNGTLVRAGRLVLAKVPGSTLTTIEVDNGGWEVQVSGADGVESEASVNAAGTQITRGPTKQDDDARDKAEHKSRVADATLDFSQAVDAISQAAPGSITELGLDDHRGTTVWEADVVDNGQPTVSVRIDAATGKVITQTTEHDD